MSHKVKLPVTHFMLFLALICLIFQGLNNPSEKIQT